jgi:hypothetical protein
MTKLKLGLHVFLGLLAACPAWSTHAADTIEKGAEDLLGNSTLSQPFTVLDQLLLSLQRRATEEAKHIRPEKNDYRPSSAVHGEVSAVVAYMKPTARTHVGFHVTVSGIDDPWRSVCERRLKNLVTFGLRLPYHEEWKQKDFRLTALGFFGDFLGPRLASDPAQLTNYKSFSDSIVVILQFFQESGGKPRFLRQCFWDNKSGQVSFLEHKY